MQRRHVASQAAASLQQPTSPKPPSSPPDRYTNFRTAASQTAWLADQFQSLESAYLGIMEAAAELPRELLVESCFILSELLERWCIDGLGGGTLSIWGKRLADMVEKADKTNSLSKQDKLRLQAAACAFQNEIKQAVTVLHTLHDDPELTRMSMEMHIQLCSTILCATARFQSFEEAFRLYGQFISRYKQTPSFTQSGFGRMIAQTPEAFENPVSLRSLGDESDVVVNLILQSFVEHKHPQLVLEFYRAAKRTRLNIPVHQLRDACRTLAQFNFIEEADELFSSLSPEQDEHQHLKLGLYLASRKGESDAAEKHFAGITRLGVVKPDDIGALLYAYARFGNVREAKRVFDEHFPKDSTGRRLNHPNEQHYAAIIYAHSHTGDSNNVAHWLKDMKHTGLTPNVQIYTAVLQTFATRSDFKAISGVLSEMQRTGVEPTVATYTVLLNIFAGKRDPSSARKIYEMALAKGVVPDVVMISALLDAYAGAGDLTGVLKIFDHMQTLPAHMQPGIQAYNIVLKAYVAAGAPFPMVEKLFGSLKERGLVPTRYTYSTFIQSACAAQRLDVAMKTHQEMVQLEEENPFIKVVSVQSMTMIMHALLVSGRRDQAKKIYDEMRYRGISPSATTFTSIIKAYGFSATRTKNREGLAIAEKFVDSILLSNTQGWKDYKLGSKHPLNQLFGALMAPHVYRADSFEVERIYQKFIEAGGQDSIGILSNLLEVYRRSNLLSKAMAIWPRIMHLAEGTTILPDSNFALTTASAPIQSPFSAYIDVLSRLGRHELVFPVWNELESKGMVPDSHNWNHLVVALLRAAQPVRAFQIIEEVLLVNEQELAKNRAIVRSLTLDMTPAERLARLEPIEHISPSKPFHGSKMQVKVQVFMKHFFNKDRTNPPEHDDDMIRANFAHPLRVLQAIRPGWNEWRPHNVILQHCLIVLIKLQEGRVIQGVSGPLRKTGDLTAHGATRRDPEAARNILKELQELAPETLKRVRSFGSKERKRLGSREYERRYILR
ncbi:hypothetical protein CVT24_011484 [Panaeolus cyanescens]|uniref:PROP1-like PPR domain-containing protein n=1 Tax=Panaeolus cyanescens TaxID=181874 RepID=A0A409VGI5_9AGAR|nr:hypothetical protein CVT24_011484 [Panaeolus cyanescens]